MKNIVILLLALTAFSCTNVKKQEIYKQLNTTKIDSVPELTYEQMLVEYDTLVSYIKQVSPIIYFNKEVRNIDFEKHTKILKQQINPKTTMPQYLNLVQQTINSAQDAHTSIVWSELAEIIKKYWLPNGIEIYNYDSTAFDYVKKYDSYFTKTFTTDLNLDLIYTSGEYYNILPFSYGHKKYPATMKLISCNDIKVHKIVNGMVELVSPLKWDIKNKRVYYENFYKSPALYKNDTIKLLFIDRENNKHTLKIGINDTIKLLQKKKNDFGYNENNVIISHYYKKEKLFYARLPQMEPDLGDSLTHRLKKIIEKNKVNAIILDVRGNGGGSDETYTRFLKKVIKEPLEFNVKVGRNFSYINSKYYKINEDTIINRHTYSFDLKNATSLDEPKMFYIQEDNYSFARPDSVQYPFTGKIYILQDRFIYSSTSNLSNLAYKSEQLVSVGENPNLLGKLIFFRIMLNIL